MSIVAEPSPVNLLSFFCAMIAAVTLKFLDPFGTGKLVLFQVTYDKVSFVPCKYLPLQVTDSDSHRIGTLTSYSLF